MSCIFILEEIRLRTYALTFEGNGPRKWRGEMQVVHPGYAKGVYKYDEDQFPIQLGFHEFRYYKDDDDELLFVNVQDAGSRKEDNGRVSESVQVYRKIKDKDRIEKYNYEEKFESQFCGTLKSQHNDEF